jgi:hypothetical protein
MAVRYNGLTLVNGNPPDSIVGQMGDLASLLEWNETDPSDDFEMNRNNYIYTWQLNRNPFIDYPELVNYVFGDNFGDQWFAPLSLGENNFSEVKVYPIPARDEITISGIDNAADVTIFSLEGVQVYQTKINGFTQLNLSLATGMYLMNIESHIQKWNNKIKIK